MRKYRSRRFGKIYKAVEDPYTQLGIITDIDEALGSLIYEMVYPYAIKVEGKNQRLKDIRHD